MDATERTQVEAVARRLWLERGGMGGSAEDDWFRACEIVRNAGNGHDDGSDGASSRLNRKERGHMEHPINSSAEQTKLKLSSVASGVMERVNTMMDSEPKSMPRMEHREGPIARTLEQQTAKIPSDAWLWAALGSIGLSLAFELSGRHKTASFIGHWAPTFLIFGLYNKIVKLQGSDGL